MARALSFIGRKRELKTLDKFLKKPIASLIVVTGRRRIGKSRLIQEFAKDYPFLRFSGYPPSHETTAVSQREEFLRQFSQQTGFPKLYSDDWSDLFALLGDKTKSGRFVILFDEISWMGSKDPDFLGKLKNAWDLYFKHNHELMLILCGSVSPWIEENILSSTGFLGRISFHLIIEELPLADCNIFWQRGGKHVSAYEKLKVLSVTGGVPRYLEEVEPSMPAEENIRDLCFTSGGLLVKEFNNIFTDLFSPRNATYKDIVRVLSKGAMEMNDICNKLGVLSSGFMSKCLDDLEKSGFLRRDYTWSLTTGKTSKLSQFRLSDNYLRFYLKYMESELPNITNNEYTLKSLTALRQWDTMMGLQFENLVLANRSYVKDSLEIDYTDIIYNNPYFQRKSKSHEGCQIDYLIHTKFNTLYVCEIKFSKHLIGVEIIDEVQKKINRLQAPKRFSFRPVLIHVNGVHEDVVDQDYFAKIIDFSLLLNHAT